MLLQDWEVLEAPKLSEGPLLLLCSLSHRSGHLLRAGPLFLGQKLSPSICASYVHVSALKGGNYNRAGEAECGKEAID